MAIVIRGEKGEPHESSMVVCEPTFDYRLWEYNLEEEVQIVFQVARGEQVRIVLSDEETLQLIAGLATRLEKRTNLPPPPERPKPVSLGGNLDT